MAANLQRTSFDIVTNGWLQWVSLVSSLGRLATSFTGQASSNRRGKANDPLRAIMAPITGADGAGRQTDTASASEEPAGRREAHERRTSEHAAASTEARRRGARSKSRRSRNG